jgi:hypothetical protein
MAGWATAIPIEQLDVSAYRIPTDAPEADETAHPFAFVVR